MAFDPDAYLASGPAPAAQPQAQAFDPDAYLAPKEPGVGTRALNLIGRGAWAIPGVVGLDAETANAGVQSLTDPNNLGGNIGDRFSKYRQGQYDLSRKVDRDNPITAGIVRGVAAAPGEAALLALLPGAKLAEGAGALVKALTYAPRIGAAAGVSEYGGTGYKPTAERTTGAVAAGLTAAALTAPAAGMLPYPGRVFGTEVPSPLEEAYRPTAPPTATAQAGAAAGAQGGGSAAGGNAASTAGSTLIVRPPKRGLGARLLRVPEPIPEAQFLLDRGVPLTEGLYNPNSGLGHVEIASQSLSHSGPQIRQQRLAALSSAMDVGFSEARPPGVVSSVPKGGINDKYIWLKGLWDDAYSKIRGQDEAIFPAVQRESGMVPLQSSEGKPGVMAQIVGNQEELWDDAARKQVGTFLENELTRLPKRDGLTGQIDLGGLLKVRSRIKTQARKMSTAQKLDHKAMLDQAADAVTEAIESQASPETVAALRSLDSNYRSFKVMESAVDRAGDAPGGISPSQLEAAVAGAVPSTSAYAAGGGGNMRGLSQAVRKVFDESGSPPTGARLLAVAPPWLQEMTVGPTIILRNHLAAKASGGSSSSSAKAAAVAASRASATEAAQRAAAMGNLPPWQAYAGSNSPSLALVNAMRLRPGARFSPAVAEEENK